MAFSWNKKKQRRRQEFVKAYPELFTNTDWGRVHVNFIGGDQRQFARIVVERTTGRKPKRYELVHHKDENPLNNDPDNLEVVTRGEHNLRHANSTKSVSPDMLALREHIRQRLERGK